MELPFFSTSSLVSSEIEEYLKLRIRAKSDLPCEINTMYLESRQLALGEIKTRTPIGSRATKGLQRNENDDSHRQPRYKKPTDTRLAQKFNLQA